jgi:hypothetical protein
MRILRSLLPLLLLLPLTSCSILWVGELGYTAHLNGPLHGATGAFHAGLGFDAGNSDREPAYGLGFSGRIRSYGAPYTIFEPGLHGYILKDVGAVSWYLRGTAYAGVSYLSGERGVVFSPTLQPGILFCPDNRIGWCASVSLPVGYDLANSIDRPGPVLGVSLGIGWGNVYGHKRKADLLTGL